MNEEQDPKEQYPFLNLILILIQATAIALCGLVLIEMQMNAQAIPGRMCVDVNPQPKDIGAPE
jgi:hypothetical protein